MAIRFVDGADTAAHRNALLNLFYEAVWGDGPVVKYVKPRPDVEPQFQIRAGAAQPV